MDRNALVVNGLTKRYQDFTLDGVSFTVPQGSIVGLIGENGAGKSTTLHAVLGLIGRDGGTVELLGLPDTALDDGVRNQIGVVFDGNSYPEMLTPRKLGRVMGKIYRTWDPDRYAALLQQLALPADKRIKALSKGMKMKLALAVAFSHHAKLLVLDEATSGLDPVVRGEMLDLFLEFIQDEGHGVLMSSHITADLERIADQIAYIHKGKLLFQQDKDLLLEDMAILRCSAGEIDSLPKNLVVARRGGAYGSAALVRHPQNVRRLLPSAVLDRADIDEIMQFISGGDKQ